MSGFRYTIVFDGGVVLFPEEDSVLVGVSAGRLVMIASTLAHSPHPQQVIFRRRTVALRHVARVCVLSGGSPWNWGEHHSATRIVIPPPGRLYGHRFMVIPRLALFPLSLCFRLGSGQRASPLPFTALPLQLRCWWVECRRTNFLETEIIQSPSANMIHFSVLFTVS